MALDVYTGTFASRTGTGTQDITAPGFSAKVVLFFWNNITTTGTAQAGQDACFGAFTRISGVTTQGAAGARRAQNGTVANSGRVHSSTKCGIIPSGAGGVQIAFQWNAENANGFQLQHTNVDGNAHVCQYLALGGADLEDAAVVQYQSPTSTGSQGLTGAGFQPTAAIIFSTGGAAASGTAEGLGALSTGVAADGSSQFCSTFLGSGSQNNRGQQASLIAQVTNSSAALIQADLTSFDADGITVDWTTVQASARYFYVLYLKGPQFHVDSDTQKTSTGTKAETGVGFQPTAVLFGGTQGTSNIYNTGTNHHIGFAAGANQNYGWTGASTSTNATRVNSSTNVVAAYTPGGASPTKSAEAALDSFDSDGYTLNWGTADATVRLFWYLALADKAPVGFVPRRRFLPRSLLTR